MVTCPAATSRPRRAKVRTFDDAVLDLTAQLRRSAAKIDGQLDSIADKAPADGNRFTL
jgi:hypothetical protein